MEEGDMRIRILTFVFVVLAAACGGDDLADGGVPDVPTTTSTTATTTTGTGAPVEADLSTPPWGLEGIALPDSADGVAAALAALPAELVGRARADAPGRFEGALRVEYGSGDGGEPLALQATPLAGIAAALGTEVTAPEWFETMTSDIDIEIGSPDADAGLMWVAASTQADDETVSLAIWCLSDGSWYFDAVGPTPEARATLVAAFVAAVRDA
jgi:hypothetical protein